MIYVVRSNTGHFYRRGKLVRNPLNASWGHSPSSMRGTLDRARAAMPGLTFEAVPLREAKVMGGILVLDSAPGVRAVVPAHTGPADRRIYVSCRQCDGCGHIGINDDSTTDSYCSDCGWSGPSPDKDKCPGCGAVGTMVIACPKCSGRYTLLADADIVPADGVSVDRHQSLSPTDVDGDTP